MTLLRKPIINEKFAALNEKGIYGFVVDRKANKLEIKKAVEAMYKVTVESVRTMNVGSRAKSRYTKAGMINGSTQAYKKAIVTLSTGEVIDFYNEL